MSELGFKEDYRRGVGALLLSAATHALLLFLVQVSTSSQITPIERKFEVSLLMEEAKKPAPPKPLPKPAKPPTPRPKAQPVARPRSLPVVPPQVAKRSETKTMTQLAPTAPKPLISPQQKRAEQTPTLPLPKPETPILREPAPKAVTALAPAQRRAIRLKPAKEKEIEKRVQITEQPRLLPKINLPTPSIPSVSETFEEPTVKSERQTATRKRAPQFGEELVTERSDVIRAQAELPSARRTTDWRVEIGRSVKSPTLTPRTTLSAPERLPQVAGVGVERRPGLASPAPTESERAVKKESPEGEFGANRPARKPTPTTGAVVADIPTEGLGGAPSQGDVREGGGSGAHGPREVMVGRPIGQGSGVSEPKPDAHGLLSKRGGQGRLAGSPLSTSQVGTPSDVISGTGLRPGGAGGKKYAPKQLGSLGDSLDERGGSQPSGFGGVGGGGARFGPGAGKGTGGGVGSGAYGKPRSVNIGRGSGVGGRGEGSPREYGAPSLGGGGKGGIGQRGSGTGAGGSEERGSGPFVGGTGAGLTGRGGGGSRKARPGPPSIGFDEVTQGTQRREVGGTGSGGGEPPRGISPRRGSLITRKVGEGGGGGENGEGGIGSIGKGKGKGRVGGAGGKGGEQGGVGGADDEGPGRRGSGRPAYRYVAPAPKGGGGGGGGLYTHLSSIPSYTIGQAQVADYWQRIEALPNFLRELHRRSNIDLKQPTQKPLGRLPLQLEFIKDVPLLYISGHQAFTLTPAEQEVLRQYVKLGGTIFGDNEHGPFDVAFQREMQRTFSARMTDIPMNAPFFQKPYRFDSMPPGDIGYTFPLRGIYIDGRWAVIYSRNDYGDCWEEKRYPQSAPGRTPQGLVIKEADPVPAEVVESAYQLGVNIYLYAYQNWLKLRQR